MVEYHFTRADYMKDAFYAVMVGLAFAALIILYTLIKMIVQIHKSRSTGKLDLIPLIFPVVITVIAVVGNILGPTWPTLQYSRFLPFESEEDSIVLSGQIESLSPVPYMRFIIDGKNYCGIAESNMAGIAAGLSTTGKVPFMSTFAMFAAGRAFEQVRNSIGYPHLNVKIGATHAGLSVGEDGATHQCNEDIALMRVIPGMVVINPSDDIEAKAAVKAAYEYVGPVYLRFGRLAAPVINDRPDYKFEIGKGLTLREGKDLTIVATGLMVSESLAAAEMLAKDGIEAKVINIHTIKPLDEELIVAAAKETGKVVTVEEHSIIGGLGSAVCDCLSEKAPTKVLKIGVNDVYGESGPAKEVLHKYGLDAEGIYTKIKAFA